MRKLNPTLVALLGGVAVLIGLIVYFAAIRSSDQDKLDQNESVNEAVPTIAKKAAAPEKLCSSQGTYELIKREIFARAAQMRGTNQAAYTQIAGFAVVRMENPVAENVDPTTGAVNCSGSLSLDLPPGVAMTGGRRTLVSNIDYSVDASGNVTLKNADALVAPLATLARTAPPIPPPGAETNQPTPGPPGVNGVAPSPSNSL